MDTARDQTTSDAPALELVLSILRAGSVLERHLDRSLSSIKGITMSEYQLLDALRQQHNATATRVDLAAAVSLSPSGVTRALKPLEKIGFVETTKDARDARRSLATLTPQGHELLDDAAGVVSDAIGTIGVLNSISGRRREEMATLLSQLG
jgi:DNA-binding MarR family transcriptional regulator